MLTKENTEIANEARWTSKKTDSVMIGFLYHGTWSDFILRLLRKFALLRVVTCEYIEGVPALGARFSYIFALQNRAC